MSHPHLLAHEFKYRLPTGDFQPARWPVVPAPAGTMCRHAGKIGKRLPGLVGRPGVIGAPLHQIGADADGCRQSPIDSKHGQR
jgi:hypothetical protein